jgi:hypothetical protein
VKFKTVLSKAVDIGTLKKKRKEEREILTH